ncbi:hypothetical protein Pyn_08518 [Prunus yedoensis var. nudiflora]|uniref:Uncharacterized protein n=1 Tax=Prunus yedoensis var. nudiflora TaxID=2094558 RepID=A0A314YVG5_PRUYE|nr:hypothetical protein Pyn_08518 [Prunus yedoensis var. nudiflora]
MSLLGSSSPADLLCMDRFLYLFISNTPRACASRYSIQIYRDGDGALMDSQEVSSPDGSELDADLMLMAAEAGQTDVIDIRFDEHICNLKREAEVFGGLGVVEFRMYKISGRKARWKG